ncbi:MAG: hypothetical protein ABEI27_10755 [Halobellus sp.]|uniref:hypothetical protein n=1 Tax=Halobellus sp. TaxID=1979212 RepID=UPI0035D45D02
MRHHRHRESTGGETTSVTRPTRAAARNRELVNRADPATDASLLPALEEGLVLLDIEQSRGVPILQSLVLDHLLLHEGPAFWVDARGYATTTGLARIAPSQRLLDRIHVARGFTPYQHYSAVCDLSEAANRTVREETPVTPSLVVVPALDAQYRGADTISERQAATLQARVLARLTAYAEAYDIPVLLTRTTTDEFAEAIETAAAHHLQCEATRLGPRFVGDAFETLVYPVADGSAYQTTFAYWRQLLGVRAARVELETPTDTTVPRSAATVGSGVIAEGERTAFAAEPLQDAWLDAAHAGGR